jgi:hypothetical protein
MQDHRRRISLLIQVVLVSGCGVLLSAFLYSDLLGGCCSNSPAGSILGLLTLPAIFVASLIGGGIHAATPIHYTIGLIVELLAIWAAIRFWLSRP